MQKQWRIEINRNDVVPEVLLGLWLFWPDDRMTIILSIEQSTDYVLAA